MHDGVKSVLVTGAGGPLGANVTRSLRQAPERLWLVGTDANRWHLPLALTDRVVQIPAARDREAYREALEKLVSEGVDVIIPTHPVEVRAIADLVAVGAFSSAKIALPAAPVLARTDDKYATWQILERGGVPVPRTCLIENPDALGKIFKEMPVPVWVRGSGAPGLGIGGAALPCRDASVAKAWIDHHRGWGKMIACEYLPGRNLTWMCAFAHGRLLAAACRERLEYVLPHVSPSGITGAPAVTRTIKRPDVAEIGERAVRLVDDRPHGVFFVDFKEDASGRACVTEINAGRCGTTVHFYTEAGFNFPWLLVCVALGRDTSWLPASPHDVVTEDLYWVRTLDCGPVLVRGNTAFDQFEKLP